MSNIIGGAVVGAIVGAVCQTKVKEMALVGALTSLIRPILAEITLWNVSSDPTSFDEMKEVAKFASFVPLILSSIEMTVFIIAARQLGVFSTKGTMICFALATLYNLEMLHSLCCSLFLKGQRI